MADIRAQYAQLQLMAPDFFYKKDLLDEKEEEQIMKTDASLRQLYKEFKGN